MDIMELQGKLQSDPPALPPRPPALVPQRKRRMKKYVVLCIVCGGLSCILGISFLSVYLVLRQYTSSLEHFETIPTYVPAIMLMITGFTVMCLARKQSRFVSLMKICRILSVLSPAACVFITVTTTVIHMNRLQRLRECVYTLKTQTCTCYSYESSVVQFQNNTGRIDDTAEEMDKSTDDDDDEDVCPPAAKQPHTSIPSNSDLIDEINNYEVDESSRGGVSQHSILKNLLEKFCTPGNLYTPNPVVMDDTTGGDNLSQARTNWSWRLPWLSRPSIEIPPQQCYETCRGDERVNATPRKLHPPPVQHIEETSRRDHAIMHA
ncbi:hypothetical protein LSTR_LSTR006699 [Laodelphax striatellus]|uniref:Uncharacterized protein n=1 Tax=Laodelphax striatellus TaxID=195883 RepID=A0A482X8R5_LAOST|nr:hypothetical protein LSTR_LSTR006699 [Laodelphax striatellus]